MKKLLGMAAFATVLFLTGCGGDDVTTTVCDFDEPGVMSLSTTVQSNEDGVITTADSEVRLSLEAAGLTADDVDLDSPELAAELGFAGFDGEVSLDGDDLVVSASGTPESLELPTDLDEFINLMELIGGTCN